MDGRTFGRLYGDVITKFSRLDGLPIFLTHGASLARSSAIIPCWALHVHVAKDNSILHYDSCILFPSSQDDFHIQLGMKKQYAASYGNF